jgi:hypothetical protein
MKHREGVQMNEDLKRCMDSIQAAIAEIKTMDSITINDIYAAKKEYGLSNEMAQLIFSL